MDQFTVVQFKVTIDLKSPASDSEGTYQPPLSGAPTDLIGHAWSLLRSPFGEPIVTLNLGSSGKAVRAYMICGASHESLGASTQYHNLINIR